MRNVTYFPPYSQTENVVTNAVLLLLSHVNRLAPDLFSNLLTTITDETFDIGPSFGNQVKVKGGKGIPDARIRQVPFDIYIETKLGDELDHKQIEDHLVTIKADQLFPNSSILLGLTRSHLKQADIDKLSSLAAAYGIRFFSTTFSELADIVEQTSADFRLGLNSIIDEYRSFIQEKGLVPPSLNRMIVNPCGTSYDQNEKHNIYHDQPGRSKILCKYLGLYRNKSVSLIGEVQAVFTGRIIDARLEIVEQFVLPWQDEGPLPITEEWKSRVLGIVDGSPFYNLRDELVRYYIVDKFLQSDFRKISPNGIQGHRYFMLDSTEPDTPGAIPDLFRGEPPKMRAIADRLKTRTWQ